MKPVKTDRSNFVYLGPTVDIGDAWVERETVQTGLDGAGPTVNVVWMDWQPSPEERQAIAAGPGVIRLGIWGMEPIPPVSLEVRPDIRVVDVEPPAVERVERVPHG
jgi:hypothetical protein